MTGQKNDSRNSAIAAAIILLAVGAVLYFMPTVILWLGDYSPVLGFGFGALVILGFFAIFWVRSRFRR